LHIGLSPNYKLTTEADVVQLIRKNLFDFDLKYFRPLGNPNKFIEGMLNHFSRLQDEDVSPADYLKWIRNQKSKIKNQNDKSKIKNEDVIEIQKFEELANAYRKYEELKTKEGLMDFGDLITKTLKLFRDRPNILEQYQKLFKYILVDEYQDTNYSQNELVKVLAGKNGNITVVADDDQSIYRFRGAAVSNILQFRKNFPKVKVVTLNKNYRSTQEILDKSYQLIQFNNPDRLEVVEKINKKLVSQIGPSTSSGSSGIHFIHTDRVENEAEEVVKEIEKLIADSLQTTAKNKNQKAVDGSPIATDYKDVAILVRANNHAEPFIRALSRHGIPHQFLGPGRLFRQPEIVDLISYLKVLYNYEDSVAFFRILATEYFDISARDIAAIGVYCRKYNLSLFEAVEKVDSLFVSDETKRKINKLMDIINKHLKMVKKETAGQILYYFLTDTGLLQKLLSPESPEAEKRAKNISKFFDKIKTYEVDHEDALVPAVVDWLELSTELGESPLAADSDWGDINAVNILTVHSAKGLEFTVVFLVNLVSQRFPTIERREQIPIPDELIKEVLPVGDYHLEEERRLFYVGATRAKDRLYLTAADYYGEGKREKKLSPFVFEMLGEEVMRSEMEIEKGKQLSFLDYEPMKQLNNETVEQSKLHIDYLSYSQIETFRTCPLHYKLKYIYKVPTAPSASQSFGTTIHSTLKDFYLAVKSGTKPTEKLLQELLEADWVKEGYKSKAHEKMFKEKGQLYLSGFLKEEFNPKVLPVMLEEPFVVPLTTNNQQLTTKSLKIGGKIDRLDEFPDGSVEIIDYKTGATIPSQKEVDKNLQLSFYALAATMIRQEHLGKNPEDVKLSLYFLDIQEKISTKRTKEDLQRAIEEIIKVRGEIEKSNFTCSGNMLCGNCEYSLFCRSEK
jgi:DNA helicase II / ATP-dependent DNA helicase PcrA